MRSALGAQIVMKTTTAKEQLMTREHFTHALTEQEIKELLDGWHLSKTEFQVVVFHKDCPECAGGEG